MSDETFLELFGRQLHDLRFAEQHLGLQLDGVQRKRLDLRRQMDDLGTALQTYADVMATPAAAPRETAERDALESMVHQFAYWSDKAGGYWTGGLSALEEAFDVLGWDDPHPEPEARCDEPGCMGQITCGWPSANGYRRTCYDHSEYPRRDALAPAAASAELAGAEE